MHGSLATAHNRSGGTMNNRQLLQNLYERLQRDQIFLNSVLSTAITTSLSDLVNSHLKATMHIESETTNIAASRCWIIDDLRTDAKFFSSTITKLRIGKARCDVDIVSSIILQNTKNTIQTLTDLHRTTTLDPRIHGLCQRYMDCQTAAIQMLKIYYQPHTY